MAKSDTPKPDPRGKIEGKKFIWTKEDGDTLVIPLRIAMGKIRELNDVILDADGMAQMIEATDPSLTAQINEMDTNDFTDAFNAWQVAYNSLAGASLGESASSSS